MSEQSENKQVTHDYACAGVPQAKREVPPLLKAIAVGASIGVGAGAAVIMLVAASTTQCRGSTRSARLMWEARQQQTERELGESAQCKPEPESTTEAEREASHE
jgi:hypothetical protein